MIEIVTSDNLIHVIAHVVDEEVTKIREEIVVGEVIVVSSRAIALPKNLIAHLPYIIARGGVPEACCPFSRCTPEGWMEKTWKTAAQGFGTVVRDHVLRIFAKIVLVRFYIVQVGSQSSPHKRIRL